MKPLYTLILLSLVESMAFGQVQTPARAFETKKYWHLITLDARFDINCWTK